MTPEEPKARGLAHIAKERAHLRDLEAEVARLASISATPVMLAMLRALVEMVCQSQGTHFAVLNKIRLYEGVLRMLREKGIS